MNLEQKMVWNRRVSIFAFFCCLSAGMWLIVTSHIWWMVVLGFVDLVWGLVGLMWWRWFSAPP